MNQKSPGSVFYCWGFFILLFQVVMNVAVILSLIRPHNAAKSVAF